jgi:hypothetical protein
MLTETIPSTQDGEAIGHDVIFHRSLCWKAIFAGLATVLGIDLLLWLLGAAIGLAAFAPITDANPGENFSIGAVVVWGIGGLIAQYVGGWIAGCFSAGPKTGSFHGIVVWSLTMCVSFGLAAAEGGMALGGVVKALGAGVGMVGKTAVAGVAGMAGGAGAATLGSNQLSSFVSEAVKSSPTNTSPALAERGQRELTLAVGKLFSPGNDVNSPDAQAGVTQALTNYTGLSEADAKRMESDWMTSYKSLKTELDQAKAKADEKARVAADQAASQLAKVATIGFFAFLLGLIATVLGSICGAKKTYYHTARGVIPVS